MCRGQIQWWQSRTVSAAPVAGWTSLAGEGSIPSAGPFAPWSLCDLNLCCEDEWRSYRFGTTWGWVINDRIFIFGRTNPLKWNQRTNWCDIIWNKMRQKRVCFNSLKQLAKEHQSIKVRWTHLSCFIVETEVVTLTEALLTPFFSLFNKVKLLALQYKWNINMIRWFLNWKKYA